MTEITALQNNKIALGRHPLLKLGSALLEVYQYIKGNPGVTANELSVRLHRKYNTVREYVRILKREGLVVDTGETRTTIKGNQSSCLRVVSENEGGYARDKLSIRVYVRVNEYGEYSVTADLIHQSPLALEGAPKLIHVHECEVAVPKITEPWATRQLFEKGERAKKPVVLEGEILDIKEK